MYRNCPRGAGGSGGPGATPSRAHRRRTTHTASGWWARNRRRSGPRAGPRRVTIRRGRSAAAAADAGQRDQGRPAVVVERLAGPGLLQDLDAFLDEHGPVGEGAPEHRELGLDVPRGDDQLEPSPAMTSTTAASSAIRSGSCRGKMSARTLIRMRLVRAAAARASPAKTDRIRRRCRDARENVRSRTQRHRPTSTLQRRGVQIGRVGAERGSAQIKLQAELHRLTPRARQGAAPAGRGGTRPPRSGRQTATGRPRNAPARRGTGRTRTPPARRRRCSAAGSSWLPSRDRSSTAMMSGLAIRCL